jgi:hypothetical protein
MEARFLEHMSTLHALWSVHIYRPYLIMLFHHFSIVTACTIEPKSIVPKSDSNRIVQKPIKALMTTYGYVLPDPNHRNRLSAWFTGGTLEMKELVDMACWKSLFSSPPKRRFQAKARVATARLTMGASPGDDHGMEADGKMTYTFERPIGGHGVAYIDVLYLDESLRIVRGTRGDVYVFARVPSFPDE